MLVGVSLEDRRNDDLKAKIHSFPVVIFKGSELGAFTSTEPNQNPCVLFEGQSPSSPLQRF